MDEKVKEVVLVNNEAETAPSPKKGYKVARVFWIIFQFISVVLFVVALLSLLIAPVLPFVFGTGIDSSSTDSIIEQLATGIGQVILMFLGAIAAIGMVAISFFVNLGSVGAGGIGFIISVIARPKGKKWKALLSFGISTAPPIILALIEVIILIVALAVILIFQ